MAGLQELPQYISIPLVLVCFIAMITLFGALLYCCRWLGVPRDPFKQKKREECCEVDGIKKETELSNQWTAHFVYKHKHAWIHWLRKVKHNPATVVV